MDKIQYQKRKQFIQVAAVIAAHQDAVKSLPALESDSKLFAKKIEQINQLAQQQLTGSRSETVAKKVARTTMVDSVMDLIGRMIAYADATSNLVLLTEIKMTRSELLYPRAATALFKARRILDKARDLQSALEKDYKLTVAVVEAAASVIEDFAILIEAPGKAIDTRTITTQTLDEVFADAGRILTRRIVGHVFTLREDHPDFIAAFEQANVLEGRRTYDAAPQGDSEALVTTAAAPVPGRQETATPHANGNGRTTVPEPVSVDLAR